MIAFIDDHRGVHGVEPICKVLPIAPSTYRAHVAKRADPARLSARARRDAALKIEVRRVFEENFGVYGVRKVWRQLKREGFDVARCTVDRLMQSMGLQGVIRGKPVRTTIRDKSAPCPLDHVNRQFRASRPNVLWVSDFTYVATWTGFVYVAFIIDAYARRIVGWRVSRTAHASFVLDALEQALHDRQPVHRSGLVHHSDRGSQSGLKRSSQQPDQGGCDEDSEAAFRESWAGAIAVARSTLRRRTRRAAKVLGSNIGRLRERGCCFRSRGAAGGRDKMVPDNRGNSTRDVSTVGQSSFGTLSLIHGAGGDRTPPRPRLLNAGGCS
jgi:putative transposase